MSYATERRMPFGKFAGVPVYELPTPYLKWLAAAVEMREPLKSWVTAALRDRGEAVNLPEWPRLDALTAGLDRHVVALKAVQDAIRTTCASLQTLREVEQALTGEPATAPTPPSKAPLPPPPQPRWSTRK